MKTEDFERWAKQAQEQVTDTSNPLKIPYDVMLQEAARTAAFVEKYWKPDPTNQTPGLSSVGSRLSETIGDEVRELVQAVQVAQSRFLLLVDPNIVDVGPRARELADELEAAIEYTLDDGVEEPADQQLAQLKEFHSQDGQRSTALAQRLRNYAKLAQQLKDRIANTIDSFDPAWIKEAIELADSLATKAANPQAQTQESKQALELRNRLLRLLTDRVASVRKASAYVFRKHPEIHRQVTSAYERKRRAERRAAEIDQPKPT